MSGWIKLHRSIQDWELYTDVNTFRLFMHMLLKTNHIDKNWRGINILRGQFISGRKQLALETGLSEQQVRTSLNRLKSTNEISTQSTNTFTLYIIENYDKYQDIGSELTKPNQAELTSGQPATNQQLTSNQPLLKNYKNDKNINTMSKNKFSDDDMTTAKWIFDRVLQVAPKTKKPNLEKWADTIRLMREQDKLDHSQICQVFKFANQDEFWKLNILSPAKLRKQFAQLDAKRGQANATNQSGRNPGTFKKLSAVERVKQASPIDYDSLSELDESDLDIPLRDLR